MIYPLKYSVGIDGSKEKFDSCISFIDSEQEVKVKATRKFVNRLKGFKELKYWINKHCKLEIPITITMEATGNYYEQLALFLHDNGFKLSVVLPTRSKKYLQSIGLKSKTDKIDAKGLSRMGAEQKLDIWEPFSKHIYQLRMITRQYERLNKLKTMTNNQLSSLEYGMYQFEDAKKQSLEMIELLEKQMAELKKKIKTIIENDDKLKQPVARITEVKGLSFLSVATIIAETNGFKLFKNQRQLVSYSGYDVVENQSGKHTGKTRISKKGNSHIRRILHMPALTVVQHDLAFKQFYNRIYNRTNIKMKAYVAVQKKLLILVYTLWKKNEKYDPNYKAKVNNEENFQGVRRLNNMDNKKVVPAISETTQDEPKRIESLVVLF